MHYPSWVYSDLKKKKEEEISHLYLTVEHLTNTAVVRKTMYQYSIYSTLWYLVRSTWYHWMLSLIVIIYNCCQIPQYPTSVGVFTNRGLKKNKKRNQCLSVRILQSQISLARLKIIQWQILSFIRFLFF